MRGILYTVSCTLLVLTLAGCGQVPLDTKTATEASVLPDVVQPTAAPTSAPTSAPTDAPTPSVVPTVTAPAAAPTVAVEAQATELPTPAPTTELPTPIPTPAQGNAITIDSPQALETVSSPLQISGSTNYWPFEATLVVEIKDASGNVLGRMPVMVDAPDIGQGGPWSDQLTFTPPSEPQEGTLDVFETSMKDGSITTIASVRVRLEPGANAGSGLQVDEPTSGMTATLPLHVAFGGGRGDEQFDLLLALSDGTELRQTAQASLGYVVTSIEGTSVPGPAELQIVRTDGTIVDQRPLVIVPPEATQTVKVAWLAVGTESLVEEERSVPSSPQIATAALEELLWGPTNLGAYASSFPSTAEIMTYSGRTEAWGARVRLIKLVITDGIATANFSSELLAYGGDPARAALIRQQIEATLRQFPSVQQVVIQIDGQSEGVLQ